MGSDRFMEERMWRESGGESAELRKEISELKAQNEELSVMLGKGPYVPLHQYEALQKQFEEIKEKNKILVKDWKLSNAYMAKEHKKYVECIDRAYFNDDKIAELERKLEIAKEALVICLKGSDTRALAAKKALEKIKEIE